MKKYIFFALLLFVVLGWLIFRPFSSTHPFQVLPPYTSAVNTLAISELDSIVTLPPGNQFQDKDIKILKQASSFWLNNDLPVGPKVYYAIDRNNAPLTSTLMILRCRHRRAALEAWTAFIPTAQKNEHRYRKRRIIHWEESEGTTYFWAMEKGLLLFSSDRRMVERSIALIDEGASKLKQALRRQHMDLKKADANCEILINSGELSRPRWHRFHWFTEGSSARLTGAASISERRFYQNIAGQEAVDFSSFLNILPDRLFYFDLISIQQQTPFFQQKPTPGPPFWNSALSSLLGPQIAYVEEGESGFGKVAAFLIAPLENPDRAEEILRETADRNGLLEDFSHQQFPIVRMLAEDVSRPFFNDRYPKLRNPYWTIAEGFLICSNDAERLRLWLDYIVVQNTIARSSFAGLPLFQEKGQRLSGWRLPIRPELGGREEDWWRRWSQQYESGLLVWKKENKVWRVEGLVKKAAVSEKAADIHWRHRFNRRLVWGPVLVKDPRNGKEHSLWVQDEEHRLFAYDLSGKLLWERQLDETILGEIETYVVNPAEWASFFNTRGKIYEVDQQGTLIFSLLLNRAAIQGLRLTYFEEPNDPHFFLPAEGGAIYGYNRLGDALVDWNPQVVSGRIGSSIRHMASPNSDHLFWLDRQGRLTAKYRTGGGVKIENPPNDIRSLFFSEKNNQTYVLTGGGELGLLSSDMKYSVLRRGKMKVAAHAWKKAEKNVVLVLSDQANIQVMMLGEEKVRKTWRMPFAADSPSLGFLENDGRLYVLAVDGNKQWLEIFDEKGRSSLPERLPSQGSLEVFRLNGRQFLATRVGEELLVYELKDF